MARLRDGKVTYTGLAPHGTVPPTPQTPFELGSITKTMTGLLLADAVQRGEMRRGAAVADYLPELAGTPAGAATVEQLATHHSGLPALPSGPPASSVLALWGNANPYAMSVETLLELAGETPSAPPATSSTPTWACPCWVTPRHAPPALLIGRPWPGSVSWSRSA